MGQKNEKGSKQPLTEIEKHLAKCLATSKESKLKSSFEALDKDKSGGLSQAEFKEFATAYIEMVRKKIAEKNLDSDISIQSDKDLDDFIEKLFHTVDANHDNIISFAEFVQFIQSDLAEFVVKAKNQKICVVRNIVTAGLEGSGKSCLLNKYHSGVFEESPQIYTLNFQVKNFETETHIVKLRLWDMPNPKLCSSSSISAPKTDNSNFLRGAHGVVFCLDLSVQFLMTHNMEIEIRNARKLSKADNVQLILVGTKTDLDRVVTRKEAEDFAKFHEMKYFEVSTKNDNVDFIFEALTNDIMNDFKYEVSPLKV